ncbi:hypothetical protein IBX65_04370 [Candidatus Aerophobetes bacterium]|nr:hypothetical protein [Candidatus Aerophobetes bacterium]
MKSGLILVGVIVFLFFQGEIVFPQDAQELSLPEVFEYPPVKERDPFSPLIQPEKKLEEEPVKKEPIKEPVKEPEKKPLPVITRSEYKLVGIIWDARGSIALVARGVNTWLVEEGMTLDGLKVARIEAEKGEVILVGEDKIIKLNMLEI